MTYTPALPLWDTQKEGLRLMGDKPAFALLMRPRTGKSPVLLANWGEMVEAGTCRQLLVVAPGGIYRAWPGFARDHLDPALYERARVGLWESQATKASKQRLDAFMAATDRPRLLIVNIEALAVVERARELVTTYLGQGPTMVAIDESVSIKSPFAKRTEFLNRKVKYLAPWRRILSGLPSPKDPLDIYPQYEFLDRRILGHASYHSFRARHAILRNLDTTVTNSQGRSYSKTVKIVVGFRNLDEIAAKIAPHSYTVPFRPQVPSTYTIREVPWHPEQKRIYHELRDQATAELDGSEHVTARAIIVRMLRLHQCLCGYTRTEDGEWRDIPERRTDELLNLLEDYDGKAIIWCSYQESIQRVVKALEKVYGSGSVARFYGGNLATREQEEHSFLNRPECRFMVGTPAAGRFGRTWTVADLCIYYSSTNDLDHRDQSEQRPLGVLKDRGVDYVDLIVPDTVEGLFLKALKRKVDLSGLILGSDFRDWLV